MDPSGMHLQLASRCTCRYTFTTHLEIESKSCSEVTNVLQSHRLTKFDERTSVLIPNSMDDCNLKNVHWLQLRTQPTSIVREMQFEMNVEMNVVRSRKYF